MNRRVRIHWFSTALVAALFGYGAVIAAGEDFTALVKRLQQEKPEFAKRQQRLLAERYDLADRPAQGVTMSRGKPVQDGRARQAAQGHDLGETRRHVAGGDQEQEPLAGRLFPLAASPPRSGRHGLPASCSSTKPRSRPIAT